MSPANPDPASASTSARDVPHGQVENRDGETVVVDDGHETVEANQNTPGLWGAAMEMFNKFNDDDGMTQAAALAFYTGLALAPLLTVVVWIATLFISDHATDRVAEVATSVVGPQAAAPIKDLLKPAEEQSGVGDESAPEGAKKDDEKPTEVKEQETEQPDAGNPDSWKAGPTVVSEDEPKDEPEGKKRSSFTLTGILSILFLAFTASSVLAQLQASLNLIWRVKPDPKINGIVTLIRKRIFSFGMLFTLLFLLLVSMMASVAIEAVFSGKREEQQAAKAAAATTTPTTTVSTTTGPVTVPIVAVAGADVKASTQAHESTSNAPEVVAGSPEDAAAATQAAATQAVAATQAAEEAKSRRWIFRIVNLVVSFIVATGVFMLLFTYLPDVRVPWRDTLFGAALTSLLFLIGRFAMGWYLGRGSYETSYGAAVGSFVALLVWVYYTSIIIFIGTAATAVYSRRQGHHPKPEKHAIRTERIERTITPVTKPT